MNLSETNTFTSSINGKTCKINCKRNRDNNCLVYLLYCKCCGKQYAEQTTESSSYRWNNYVGNDRKHARNESCMHKRLFEYFNRMGHSYFLNKV